MGWYYRKSLPEPFCMNQMPMWLAVCLLIGGCAAPLDFPRTPSTAFDHPEATSLGKKLAAHLAADPRLSGFHLLPRSTDALSARLALIEAAEKSVDAQYFEFEDDTAGNLVVDRLLAAAGRGVRVRILVDDWNQTGQDDRLACLGAQPNIEVRVFNPVGGPRACALNRPLQYLLGPGRHAHRMHNKALVADSAAAIVGGRNLADAYFAARSDFHFGDVDLLAAGPIAQRIAAAFDEYWNDRLAVPIEAFVSLERTAECAQRTRLKLDPPCASAVGSEYARELHQIRLVDELDTAQLPLIWAEGELLYDRPAKVVKSMAEEPAAFMVLKLREIMGAVQREALIITPYFVPGQVGVERLGQLRQRQVEVKVLTNSLASTDAVAAHGGYARYRPELLRLGVELYEARPDPNLRRARGASSGRSALHAKCIVLDREMVFIGSLNLDPRSARLDTQDGIIIRSPELAGQASQLFARRSSPRLAFHVTLQAEAGDSRERLLWTVEDDEKTLHFAEEPETGACRRLAAWLLYALLPERWM